MNKEEKIRIVYKAINKVAKVIVIDNDSKEFRKLVKGLVEVVGYKDDIDLICNEEREVCNLLKNLILKDDVIRGDCFFVGNTYKGYFRSLTDDEISIIMNDISNCSVNYIKNN